MCVLYFWKRIKSEKQGIADIRILLNDERCINIEIQLCRYACWDKRQLFYLSKAYTERARRGEDYRSLSPCISISILDFNLIEDDEYFHCYKLRDDKGGIFSEEISLYLLEIRKTHGTDPDLEDWRRLFRARTEEELDMIKTKNRGILEAVKELKTISLTEALRQEYELRLKWKRDAKAREEYVHETGIEQGLEQGEACFAQLAEVLLEASRTEELKLAAKDKAYRDMLYKQYGIQNSVLKRKDRKNSKKI